LIVTDPGLVAVIATEQLPDERVQVVDVKVTKPVPLWENVILPVGKYPATVALQETGFDWTTGDGEQVTEVKVGMIEPQSPVGLELPKPLFLHPSEE